jgi:hypothetical protein
MWILCAVNLSVVRGQNMISMAVDAFRKKPRLFKLLDLESISHEKRIRSDR